MAPSAADVFLIVADDIAYEDLMPLLAAGALPNLERIAERGTTFHAAYANGVCSPTRQSLQLGRWRFGDMGPTCDNRSEVLDPSELTLAELCPRAGLFGKWHIGSNPSGNWATLYLEFGYETWFGTPGNLGGSLLDPDDCGSVDYREWTRVQDGVVSTNVRGYQPIAVQRAALEWLARTPGPRLLDYRPALAHGPNHAPPASLLPTGMIVGPSQREKYEAMILALDATLAPILDEVEWDKDLVIFVGDNGTPEVVTPEPGRSKTTTFERGIHVPLFLSGPGSKRRDSSALVHVVDVYTTIAAFFGTPTPAHDGISLIDSPGHEFIVCTGKSDLMARTGTVKFRRQVDGGGEELYDLAVDPHETRSLLGDPRYAARANKLRSVLGAFQARTR